MKKAILILNFVIISADVSGMIHERADIIGAMNLVSLKSIAKNDKEPELFAPNPQRNVRRVESSHARQISSEPKDQSRGKKPKMSRKGKEPANDEESSLDVPTQKDLDPQAEEKINNFVEKFKSKKGKGRYFFGPDKVKKILTEYYTQPDVPMKEIAKRNGISEHTVFCWKKRAGLLSRCRLPEQTSEKDSISMKLDSRTKEKIRDFAQNRKHKLYNAKQIEEALIDWVTEGKNKSNEISLRSLSDWSQKLGIVSINKMLAKSIKETKQKLINNLNRGVEWKDIHYTIGKRPRAMRKMLGRMQDKGQVEILLSEDEKEDLITDYRKGLFTKKGLAKKYEIKESDVFCIIHEARKNGRDLSRLNVDWFLKYSCNKIPAKIKEKLKKNVVKDYNKALLTRKGLGAKYNISLGTIKNILSDENSYEVKRRNGKLTKDEELVLDMQNKSLREIENKYGYKPDYVDDLKRQITHWGHLTDDQKNLFKETMKSKTFPDDEVLSSIKQSEIYSINEKFKKFLFVLIATPEEIMEKFHLTSHSVNRLRRCVSLWKVLAKEQ